MFNKLSNLLDKKFSKKNNLSKQVEIVKVFAMYKDGVSAILPNAPEVKPISLKNGMLTVEAQSPSHASELRMRESQIIETINSSFGRVVIKRIKYRF